MDPDSPRPPSDIGRVALLPSITDPADCRGAVIVCGSHGGSLAASLAAEKQPLAVVLHDAGIGLARAGVAGLDLLDRAGIPAASVSHRSARIGDPEDMLSRGTLSTVNARAARLGLSSGMATTAAVELLTTARWSVGSADTAPIGSRTVLHIEGGRRALVLADSASMVDPTVDADAVVVTGSHGGLVGGDVTYGVKARAFAAAFNDAGGGIDDVGFMRLHVLERDGIAAATVSADSARIGDAASTLAGTVSRVNAPARQLGLRPGDLLAPAVFSWILH